MSGRRWHILYFPAYPTAALVFSRALHYIGGMDETFHIAPNASARIAHLLGDEPAGSRLRIAVDGGGCSGFQYHYAFVLPDAADDDVLFGTAEAPVVVDRTSLQFLSGSVLEYTATLGAAAFEIKNPLAKSSCGCGNSFSVAL